MASDSVSIKLVDNSGKTKQEMERAIKKALTEIGIVAENYAVDNIRASVKNASGTLANSIDSVVDDDTVTIGTNLYYAIYNELGTGKYGEKSTGDGWWVYVAGDDGGQSSRAKGKRYTEAEARKIVAILRSKGLEAHMTQGMEPKHFLKKAIAEHVTEYKTIAETELKG